MPKCNTCGRVVASNADACPGCGRKKPATNFLAALIVAIIVLYIISRL